MPSQTALSSSSQLPDETLVNLIVDSLQDIKGKRIVRLDLREVEDSPAKFFVVCEGESLVQVKALAENIRKRVRNELGERPAAIEGMDTGLWVCLDYFDIVVHIFGPKLRDFYDLESLWSDASKLTFEDL